MSTIIEVFDDSNLAAARIVELKTNPNVTNPRVSPASRVALYDRRKTPGNPPTWNSGANLTLFVVQYETT
jgi:hypothetical protein